MIHLTSLARLSSVGWQGGMAPLYLAVQMRGPGLFPSVIASATKILIHLFICLSLRAIHIAASCP